MSRSRKQGFTLLELLVALGVFAIIGMLATQLLRHAIQVTGVLETRMDRVLELQRATGILRRDVAQVIHRPVRDQLGRTLPAVQIPEPNVLEFTRTGWLNPLEHPRSNLQRVSYELRGKNLIRSYWNILDRIAEHEPIEQVLLTRVENVFFEVLATSEDGSTPSGTTISQWPEFRGGDRQIAMAVIATIETAGNETLQLIASLPTKRTAQQPAGSELPDG